MGNGPRYQPANGPVYMAQQPQQPGQVNGPVYIGMAQQRQQPQMGYVNGLNNKQQGVDMGYGNNNVGQRGGGPMGVHQQQQQQPGRFGNQLMQQVLSGMIDGASQQIGQSLLQGFMGGGGGDGGGGDGGGGGFDS